MKYKNLLLLIIFMFALAIGSYKIAYSLFNTSVTNTGNSFTTAADFGNPQSTGSGQINPGDVIINEVNWAGSFNTDDEWLELKNMTNTTINLSGWAVEGLGSGASPIVIPAGKNISGNGFFLISNFNEATPSSNLNITPDLVTSSVSLANTSELLVLKTATNGATIDTAGQATGNWFAGSNSLPKKSMERNNPPLDGTVLTNWHSATTSVNLDLGASESGTPKAAND